MSLLCPSCKTDLVMADRQGVEIDYCPKCRGVWLDRGELDKIIERGSMLERGGAAPSPAPQPAAGFMPQQGQPFRPAPRRDDDDHDDRRHDEDDRRYHQQNRHVQKPHKQKSWLSDIFD